MFYGVGHLFQFIHYEKKRNSFSLLSSLLLSLYFQWFRGVEPQGFGDVRQVLLH